MDANQTVVTESPREDRLGKNRTIYDAGAGEIFWKNFLAGISRGIGSVFIYLLVLLGSTILFYHLFWPKIAPLLNTINNLNGLMQNGQNTQQNLQNSLNILKP